MLSSNFIPGEEPYWWVPDPIPCLSGSHKASGEEGQSKPTLSAQMKGQEQSLLDQYFSHHWPQYSQNPSINQPQLSSRKNTVVSHN